MRLLRAPFAAILLTACGDTAACPDDLPASCPAGAPGYAATIAPILASRCASCHGPGGSQATRPLVTWDDVHARRGEVLSMVYGCRMPPEGSAPLADDERAALLSWLVCGAPND